MQTFAGFAAGDSKILLSKADVIAIMAGSGLSPAFGTDVRLRHSLVFGGIEHGELVGRVEGELELAFRALQDVPKNVEPPVRRRRRVLAARNQSPDARTPRLDVHRPDLIEVVVANAGDALGSGDQVLEGVLPAFTTPSALDLRCRALPLEERDIAISARVLQRLGSEFNNPVIEEAKKDGTKVCADKTGGLLYCATAYVARQGADDRRGSSVGEQGDLVAKGGR